MSFICPVCCEEYVFISKLCPSCSKIKHYCSIYGRERVYSLLNNVLSREEDKIKNKEKLEIHKEIENLKEKVLKPSQVKRGTEVD
jgi:hypothetical protein|tara:strand:- start:373 stop:627 length:255 start_codon:yes stop_codon:yes gene_type:complete